MHSKVFCKVMQVGPRWAMLLLTETDETHPLRQELSHACEREHGNLLVSRALRHVCCLEFDDYGIRNIFEKKTASRLTQL
jgi:hypothetical protein